VVAVQGDRVRLGIKAPPAVCVDRKEVHERRTSFAQERCSSEVSCRT
jgi:sRNA-binding carbon storage regulator CsrA